ncbi:MAG: hypothetical protein H7Y31_15055, partial [Chitinophagaceae bacterium]|nr:hypothetical protein [Chitinophagaceae bacterium]
IATGSGGGETITSGILAGTGTGNDIVDWVFAELRNSTTGVVITSRAVLIERDGDIVDVDGTGAKTNFINFAGELAGNYHVSIRHRNHLGIRTPAGLGLARTTATPYNFSTSAAQALSGVQFNLGGGFFGMYGGNVNGNTTVRFAGPANDQNELINVILGANKSAILSGVYNRGDLNMNGVVRYAGPNNDENFLINVVLGANKAAIITQPF